MKDPGRVGERRLGTKKHWWREAKCGVFLYGTPLALRTLEINPQARGGLTPVRARSIPRIATGRAKSGG